MIFRLAVCIIPFWPLKRWFLQRFYGYKIHPSARIGLSYVYPKYLAMGPSSRIGDLNVCKGISCLVMEEFSAIGRLNWITGFPKLAGLHFMHQPNRDPRLLMRRHSAITNRHIVDCTASVDIGAFATIAGFRSQILSHSIDLLESIQSSKPIVFGARCFIGSSVVILPGAVIPPKCVVAAGSVVIKPLEDELTLYAGVPARAIKSFTGSEKYFLRTVGYVT